MQAVLVVLRHEGRSHHTYLTLSLPFCQAWGQSSSRGRASCRDKKKKKKGDGEDGSGGGDDDDDDENGDANGADEEADVVWMTDTSEAAAQVRLMLGLVASLPWFAENGLACFQLLHVRCAHS